MAESSDLQAGLRVALAAGPVRVEQGSKAPAKGVQKGPPVALCHCSSDLPPDRKRHIEGPT